MDFRPGVKEMTVEHDEMAEALTRLLRCVADGARTEAADVLTRLMDGVRGHFAREEALMELCPDYTEAFTHRLAHSKFLLRLERMAKVVDLSGEMSEDMVRMVEGWWHSHVERRDQALVDALQLRFAAAARAAE